MSLTSYFFLCAIFGISVNTKIISWNVLKISAISRVLRTRDITDIFNAFHEIYLVLNFKKVNILYVFLAVGFRNLSLSPFNSGYEKVEPRCRKLQKCPDNLCIFFFGFMQCHSGE